MSKIQTRKHKSFQGVDVIKQILLYLHKLSCASQNKVQAKIVKQFCCCLKIKHVCN